MDLYRAYETLGLSPGASASEVQAAYGPLCADIDSRIAHASTAAIRDRYAEARAELDLARLAALAAIERGERPPERGDPRVRAWSVLGLLPHAPPLEVATAYVALCEELERDLTTAPTEPLRRRALEARAEVDQAYQMCSAQLVSGAEPDPSGSGTRYETQVATEAFEAAPPEPEPELETDEAFDPPTQPVEILLVEPDAEHSQVLAPPLAALRVRPRRKRRRRRLAFVSILLLLVAGGVVAWASWSGTDLVQIARRFVPERLDTELVRSQTSTAYLRRRIAEERIELESRSARTRERVERLEAQMQSSGDPEQRERLQAELTQARARRSLAHDLVELTETHVFSGSDLAQAYGKFELGLELVSSGDHRRAREAFDEAREGIEFSLRELDLAEEALGARSEAVSARDAWMALADSAGLEDPGGASRGRDALAAAEALIEEGRFEDAEPELRRASQHFLVALDEGRKVVAAERAARAAELEARAAAEALAEGEALAEAEALARADAIARRKTEARARAAAGRDAIADGSDVAAPPPGASQQRASIKLVSVPEGDFLFGCNDDVDVECLAEEKPGERLSLSAFLIDRTEVRVTEYGHCVQAGACTEPDRGALCNWSVADRGDHPVNCVDWAQARAYCGWVDKRLPSEREWEKAARGTDGRKFPWGNEEASCERAVIVGSDGEGCGRRTTWPVASREGGRSPYGLFDMAGNVLEWTSDRNGGNGRRVLRGGSWRSFGGPVRASHREHIDASTRASRIGFRCARGDDLVADSQAP